MDITSAQYVTDLRGGDSTILAVIDGTPMTVPQDPSNSTITVNHTGHGLSTGS